MGKGLPCCNEEVDDNDNDDDGNGVFGFVLAFLSLAIILLFLPFSLCACLKVLFIFDQQIISSSYCLIPCIRLKVVQEYERAVIFRLVVVRNI